MHVIFLDFCYLMVDPAREIVGVISYYGTNVTNHLLEKWNLSSTRVREETFVISDFPPLRLRCILRIF